MSPLMLLLIASATAMTDQSKAEEAAKFVLDSLVEMSDSGIYGESLRLNSVSNVSVVDGLYHTNTQFLMELESEHFESGKELEDFDVVVMESRAGEKGGGDEYLNIGGNRRGYAIDRFPKMKDEQIEAALRRKVARTVQRNKQIRKEVLSW